MHRECDAGNGAEGVCGVDHSNGAFTLAWRCVQDAGCQRQRHAGAKRGREHDQRRDPVTREVEQGVALIRLWQRVDQVGGEVEGQGVQRDRGNGGKTHRDLHITQQYPRVRHAVDPLAHPEATHCQAEDERRQHQFERVCGAAQRQRQHADPAHLVNEGRRASHERHHQHQQHHRCQLTTLLALRWLGAMDSRARHPCHQQCNRQVDHARSTHRAGQAKGGDQDETGGQHTDRTTQAVGKVQGRDGSAFVGGERTRGGGGKERKG